MPRRARPASRTPKAVALAAFVLLGLSLDGCATAGTAAGAAGADDIAAQAGALGIAPELVYTTDVDGYDLAPQSVGANGSDGMSATWVGDDTGAMVTLRTERGEIADTTACASVPLWDAPDEPVTCVDDGGVWHRSGGGIHEYAVVSDGATIRVIGTNGTPQADVRSAAQAVHVPSEAELENLFSAVPETPTAPVERGDIPENGDGAPVDPVGPGG